MFEPAFLVSLLIGTLTTLIRVLRNEPRLQAFWSRIERNQSLTKLFKLFGFKIPAPRESYQERTSKLFAKFQQVTEETEEIVSELERNLRTKENVVNQLDQRHKDLDEKLEKMKQLPEYSNLRTLDLLEQLIRDQKRDGRRSALRDYGLYILGVATPYVINWITAQSNTPKPAP